MNNVYLKRCDTCKFHQIRGTMMEQVEDYCSYLHIYTSAQKNCLYYEKHNVFGR